MVKSKRLTVIELKNSDIQIVNELVYRWCRILTRPQRKPFPGLPSMSSVDTSTQQQVDSREVLVIDLIGAFSPIRLASILHKKANRLKKIGLVRGCKINSTIATISSYLGQQAKIPESLKLVVIYQDEFYIVKTLDILKEFINRTKCQILFIVPRLDRRDKEVLNVTTINQILKCDFRLSRADISRVQRGSSEESQLNHVYIMRNYADGSLPDKVTGELRDDGMHLFVESTTKKQGQREGFKLPSEPESRVMHVIPALKNDAKRIKNDLEKIQSCEKDKDGISLILQPEAQNLKY